MKKVNAFMSQHPLEGFAKVFLGLALWYVHRAFAWHF